jgi:hypothetical protein
MKRAVTIFAVVGCLATGLQAVALGADRSGSTTSPEWTHVQSWGDWCNFQADTAPGHATAEVYKASTETTWEVDEAGNISQTVTQVGTMTTDGATRPFSSRLVTSGPPSAYLDAAPLAAGEDLLDPRFFDESLTVEYIWTVENFYTFEFHNIANDGAPAEYGPTYCG